MITRKLQPVHTIFLLFTLLIISQQPVSANDNGVAQDLVTQAQEHTVVQHLTKWLEQQGYKMNRENILIDHFSDKSFGKSQESVDIGVVLLPFLDDSLNSARIAYWSGNWNDTATQGAVTVIDDSNVYGLDEEDVVVLDLDTASEYFDFPIYTLPGSVPPDSVSKDIQVRMQESGCKTLDAYRAAYSLLGFTLFRFHQHKYFCYGNGQVTNVSVSAYVSHMDWVAVYNGVVSSWDHHHGSSHDSMRQGQIQLCVVGDIGCYATYHPAVQIIVYSSGNYWYTTWQ